MADSVRHHEGRDGQRGGQRRGSHASEVSPSTASFSHGMSSDKKRGTQSRGRSRGRGNGGQWRGGGATRPRSQGKNETVPEGLCPACWEAGSKDVKSHAGGFARCPNAICGKCHGRGHTTRNCGAEPLRHARDTPERKQNRGTIPPRVTVPVFFRDLKYLVEDACLPKPGSAWLIGMALCASRSLAKRPSGTSVWVTTPHADSFMFQFRYGKTDREVATVAFADMDTDANDSEREVDLADPDSAAAAVRTDADSNFLSAKSTATILEPSAEQLLYIVEVRPPNKGASDESIEVFEADFPACFRKIGQHQQNDPIVVLSFDSLQDAELVRMVLQSLRICARRVCIVGGNGETKESLRHDVTQRFFVPRAALECERHQGRQASPTKRGADKPCTIQLGCLMFCFPNWEQRYESTVCSFVPPKWKNVDRRQEEFQKVSAEIEAMDTPLSLETFGDRGWKLEPARTGGVDFINDSTSLDTALRELCEELLCNLVTLEDLDQVPEGGDDGPAGKIDLDTFDLQDFKALLVPLVREVRNEASSAARQVYKVRTGKWLALYFAPWNLGCIPGLEHVLDAMAACDQERLPIVTQNPLYRHALRLGTLSFDVESVHSEGPDGGPGACYNELNSRWLVFDRERSGIPEEEMRTFPYLDNNFQDGNMAAVLDRDGDHFALADHPHVSHVPARSDAFVDHSWNIAGAKGDPGVGAGRARHRSRQC